MSGSAESPPPPTAPLDVFDRICVCFCFDVFDFRAQMRFFIIPPPFLHPLSHQRNQEVFSTRRPHTRPHRCCGAWLQPTPVCQCAHCPLSRRSRARLLGFQTGATFPSPPDPGARRDAVHTCVHAGLRRGGRRTRRRTTAHPPGRRSRARSLRFRTGAPAPTRLTMSVPQPSARVHSV